MENENLAVILNTLAAQIKQIKDGAEKEISELKKSLSTSNMMREFAERENKKAEALLLTAQKDLSEMALAAGKICQCGDGECSIDGGDID